MPSRDSTLAALDWYDGVSRCGGRGGDCCNDGSGRRAGGGRSEGGSGDGGSCGGGSCYGDSSGGGNEEVVRMRTY